MLHHTEVVAKGISLILCLGLVICDFLLWTYILVCHIENNFTVCSFCCPVIVILDIIYISCTSYIQYIIKNFISINFIVVYEGLHCLFSWFVKGDDILPLFKLRHFN